MVPHIIQVQTHEAVHDVMFQAVEFDKSHA